MKRYRSILFIALCAALFFSCAIEEVAAPKLDYEPEIVVFGLLLLTDWNEGQQKTIRIERTYEIADTLPDYEGERAVTDARVFIESADQRVEFVHTFNSNYEDVNDRLTLTPGQTYALDITMPDGHKITSQCILPDRPKILFPTSTSRVEAFKPLSVRWQPANFAYRYQISVEEDFNSFSVTEFSSDTETDLYFFIWAPPGRYILKVASLDQNYYDYLRTRQDRTPISHISGAIGVFGGIAYSRSTFRAVSP